MGDVSVLRQSWTSSQTGGFWGPRGKCSPEGLVVMPKGAQCRGALCGGV